MMNKTMNVITYFAIISDLANGYTYRTRLAVTRDKARKLANDFIMRKNIDCCNIDIVQLP